VLRRRWRAPGLGYRHRRVHRHPSPAAIAAQRDLAGPLVFVLPKWPLLVIILGRRRYPITLPALEHLRLSVEQLGLFRAAVHDRPVPRHQRRPVARQQ
jgi:hypothetical protein